MRKFISSLLFLSAAIVPGQYTLRSIAWDRIKRNSPNVYKLRKERTKFNIAIGINTSRFAFIAMPIFYLIWGFICVYTSPLEYSFLSFLNCIKVEKDSAKQLITDGLMATATISAISSVVISFLFETVREKTQETYENLFRATKLYYILPFVLYGLIYLLIANMIKHTVNVESALPKLSIWSTYIAIFIVGSISFMFYQVLRYFNPERVALLSKGYLLMAAKFERLDEKLAEEYNKAYEELFEINGFQQANFSMPSIEPLDKLVLENKTTGYFFDLFIPLIKRTLNSINRQREGAKVYYLPIKYHQSIDTELYLGHIPETIKLKKTMVFTTILAYRIRAIQKTDGSLLTEKSKMQDRLKKASGSGDLKLLNEQLSNIQDLYDTYYNL